MDGCMDHFNLPGYEVIERIGVGGMATVWMARQIALDRIVAVKVLSRSSSDMDLIERFRLEAQAAAKLNHPGIVQIYDAGEHEGVAFYVMEFVAGFTVGELLRRKGHLTDRHALLIAQGVAHALSYAWSIATIIHCDVKPDNIMIDRDGTVKVADLGLAKIIGLTMRMADDDLIIGTPNYTSPEQARGDKHLDCRADIYSLGAMLYHMVTGTLPFGYCEGTGAMDKHITSYLPDPTEVNHHVSLGMAWLIEKMMIKDRSLRSQSWREVLDDFESVREGGPPLGELPAMGISTVIRSEKRSNSPLPRKRISVTRTTRRRKRTDIASKKQIVLTREMRDALQARGPELEVNLSSSLFVFGLLAVLVLGSYSGFLWFGKIMPKSRPTRDQPSIVVPGREESRGRPTSDVGDLTEPSGHVKSSEAVREGLIRWKDPNFLRGARSFNAALKRYEEYLEDRSNDQLLPSIEKHCRDAIREFEQCKSKAPSDLNVGTFINDCYRMIADCRQFTLVASAKKRPADQRTTSPSSPVDVVKEPSKPESGNVEGIRLSAGWNVARPGEAPVYNDLFALLHKHGQAKVDLVSNTSLTLYKKIAYLAPVRKVALEQGLHLGPRRTLVCPGFPSGSFFYYTASGRFSEEFERMVLIADLNDRVVGVQLVDERPSRVPWLDAHSFTKNWHAYNFVQTKMRKKDTWHIAHRVFRVNRDVLRIDSELVEGDPKEGKDKSKPKERVQLFLPQQIVDLILFRVEGIRKSTDTASG